MTRRALFFAVLVLDIALQLRPAWAGTGAHDILRPIVAAVMIGSMAVTIVALVIWIALPHRTEGE